MVTIDKSTALKLSTPEGVQTLLDNNYDINDYHFIPMVGFTMPETGWHLYEENLFFIPIKNPKVAYWIAYWMGELNCLNPFKSGKGIFHKVVMIEKTNKLDKELHLSNLGVS